MGTPRRIHLVGIGGAGMSAIAEVLRARGETVSGSDLLASAATERLVSLGVRVRLGHAAENAADAEVLVHSAAVAADNPELLEAQRRGIPVVPRAEMLAELMRGTHAVAVAGSHGKSTTTAMIGAVLEQAGLDPTVVVGGRLAGLGSGARVGRGSHMVVEADESDRSFLRLRPTLAVVTNVDREHLDAYRDLADVQQAFVQFANGVAPGGVVVACVDDEPTRGLLPRVARRVVGYGLSPEADVGAALVTLRPTSSSFTVLSAGERLGTLELQVPGVHNVANALAAVAAGRELGVAFEAAKAGLEAFRAVERRFEIKGEAGGVTVVDDYGHHPTEIRATLETLRAFASGRRTLVLFQPHRHTRTRALLPDFVTAFDAADVLWLTDVYGAGEAPLPGGPGALELALAIARAGRVAAVYAGDLASASERLAEQVLPGDVVLTLGAGDVYEAGELLLRRRAGRG